MPFNITDSQLCEAFDPMMIVSGKLSGIAEKGHENTSCKAPAYVYLEGSRGKRFLCDFHYFYEKDMTIVRSPKEWLSVERFVTDRLEEIRETFQGLKDSDFNYLNLIKNNDCWCGSPAHMLTIARSDDKLITYYCNFHYRKTYYRHLTNGCNFLDTVIVKDARKSLHQTPIREEAEGLTQI